VVTLVGGRQPDLGTVDVLARFTFVARSSGYSVALHDPSPRLRELLHLAGLGTEMQWLDHDEFIALASDRRTPTDEH